MGNTPDWLDSDYNKYVGNSNNNKNWLDSDFDKYVTNAPPITQQPNILEQTYDKVIPRLGSMDDIKKQVIANRAIEKTPKIQAQRLMENNPIAAMATTTLSGLERGTTYGSGQLFRNKDTEEQKIMKDTAREMYNPSSSYLPSLQTVAEMGGMVVSPLTRVVGAGVGLAGKALGRFAPKIIQNVVSKSPIIQGSLQAGGDMGVWGGATKASDIKASGENVLDHKAEIAKSALENAGMGMLFGGGIGLAAKGLSKVANPMAEKIQSKLSNTTSSLRPQTKIQATESPLIDSNIQSNINSPSIKRSPLEGKINADTITPPKATFEHIKTIQDLPNDIPTLELYVKEIQAKHDAPFDPMGDNVHLLDVNLQLFAAAKKKLGQLSEFYSNSIQRMKELPDHIKAEIDPSDFEITGQKVAKWDAEARANVATDRAKVEDGIRNSVAIDGGVKGHESAEIMRQLIAEGNTSKVIKWLKTVASKVTETARGLKSIDSAYPKNSSEYQLLKAQRATNKTTDDILSQNPKVSNEVKSTTKQAEQIQKSIKKETEKAIDEVTAQFEKSRTPNLEGQETSFPKMLQEKISKALNPKPQEKSFIKDIINDLFGEAKESVKFPKAPKLNNSVSKLSNSYKYREYAGEIRTKAQELLKQEFADSPKALAILDDYFNKGFRPPHSQKLLNDIMSKRMGGLGLNPIKPSIPVNKPNFANLVKDWFASGKADSEKFIQSIMDETGLTGEEANSLRNLIESKVHVATKQMKDKLLETVMKQSNPSIIKNAITKLKEFTNIGGFENTKFTNRISEKITPMLKQLLKENDINLNEVVKSSLLGQTRMRVLGEITDSLKGKISDVEIENLMHIIKKEFNTLADVEKNKVLKGVFGEKNIISTKFASEKLAELTHAGMFESTKFANVISEKLDPTIRKLISENGLNINDLVRLSTQENVTAKKDLIANFFNTTSIRGSERDKIISFIESEFNKVSKDTRFKILKEMAKPTKPSNKRTMIEKLREKINLGLYGDDVDVAIQDAIKEKYGLPTLSSDEVKFITETMDLAKTLPENSQAYLEAMAKVEKLILEKTPSSLSQKAGSGAFISLLLNTTSGTVNVGSNLLEGVASIGTNPIRRGIDKLISPLGNIKGQRASGKTNFGSLAKGAWEGLKGTGRDFLGGRNVSDLKNKSPKEIYDILANPINTDISNIKYGDKFEVGGKLAFENRPARVLENLTGTIMKGGDRPFFQAYLDEAIESLTKANEGKGVPIEQIKELAHQRASERTYKDLNIISNALMGIKNLPKQIQAKMGIDPKTLTGMRAVIAEAIPAGWEAQLRFAKTPGNVAKRLLEYTPLGLAEGFGKLALNKGNITLQKQGEIVDRLTRGMAGTLLGGLGYGAASAGMLSGKRDKTKRYEDLKSEAGRQSDSLKIGNTNIDLTRGLPFTAPIIAGARLQQKDTKGLIDTGVDSITSSADLFSEMGLLQNIKKLVGTSYSGKDGEPDTIGEKILSATLELPRQYVPSMAKKIKNWVDTNERDLSGGNFLQRNLTNQIGGNLPFSSKLYPAKIDYKGEPIKRFQGNNTFVNAIFNPIKVTTEVTDDKTILESLRLFGTFKDPTLLLPKVSKKIMEDKELTNDEVTQYQQITGKNVQKIIDKLINNPEYVKADDTTKSIGFEAGLNKAKKDSKLEMLKKLNVDIEILKREAAKEAIENKKIIKKLGVLKKP